MKDENPSKYNYLLYVSLAIMAIVTFAPLFSTGIGCADDLQSYLVARWGNFMADAGTSAKIAGRFYYYIVKPLNILPYIVDNPFVIKLFQHVPLVICFLLFARILFMLTRSKEMAFLYIVLFFATAQISGYTSLFVTYPFYYTFSFSLLLLSFIYLLIHLESKKQWPFYLSLALYGVGLLFYETYLLYLLIIFLTILYYSTKEKGRGFAAILQATRRFLPFMAIAIAYLVVYVVFRIYHPSMYDGTSFKAEGFKWAAFFDVLWSFSYTAFPLAVFQESRNFFGDQSELVGGYSPVVLKLLLSAKMAWIIKGGLVALIGYMLLTRIRDTRLSTLGMVTVVSVILIFAPHIPLALTPKYTFYVSYGMIGYVTTFFSLFGVLLFLTYLLSYLLNLLNFNKYLKRSVAGFIVIGLFTCSVLTDFSNYYVAKDIRWANMRFKALDELLESDAFNSIPEESHIYMKDLYENPSVNAHNLTEQSFNWAYYIDTKIQKKYLVYREDKEFLQGASDTTKTAYYFTKKQALKTDDIALIFAPIKPASGDTLVIPISNMAVVEYYSPYKTFTVTFRCKKEDTKTLVPLRINHIPDTLRADPSMTFTIYNTRKYEKGTIFTIRTEGIDLKSINISNIVDPENKVFYL
jgi:hypothetical protein